MHLDCKESESVYQVSANEQFEALFRYTFQQQMRHFRSYFHSFHIKDAKNEHKKYTVSKFKTAKLNKYLGKK